MNQNIPQNITTKRSGTNKYRKYDHRKRLKLIQMIQKDGKSLASSAKFLGIAQTTARLIMKTWREEGRVFEKKTDKAKRERREAQKLSQAKRKEKQRLKKEAKKQRATPRTLQRPPSQVKIQENEPQDIQQVRIENMPQPLMDANLFYPTWPLLQPVVYVMPPAVYYGQMGL